ncbi:hypothetical protein TRIATDRAFT_159587 [Trichoderma atroviride IMI 206040]|uniref:Uncharacterized protein n=1 Tax=Hypocrea atroviridis (strain ATCC 20476 / IMI 206040) TaxID=452589 RepID=G9NSN2_HYPAI|nr:uncharacterized protein TRIATDRAFT_159587 [Trichoderma atroviride IMI 206040]EHK46428.1 hypothetical protein TRIATDRAFT_159587 [Trichoderma atroviride IMI 206040]
MQRCCAAESKALALARKSRASLRDVPDTGCDNNAYTLVLRASPFQPAEMEA